MGLLAEGRREELASGRVGVLLAGLGELVDLEPTAGLEDGNCGSGSLAGEEQEKEGAVLGSDWE